MKKNLLLILLSALMLVGCGKSEETNSSSEPGSQESGGGEIHTDPVVKTVTLTTFGNSYEAEFSNGTQFGTDHAGNVSKLLDFLNNQSQEVELIRSLECVSLNSLDDLEKDGSGDRYLTVGTKSSSGSLTMNFNYAISKVEVLCVNYHNTFTGGGGGYNCDDQAHLNIGDNDLSLELTDKTNPVTKTLSIDYSPNVASIKIENSSGRVFIKSITLTYKA